MAPGRGANIGRTTEPRPGAAGKNSHGFRTRPGHGRPGTAGFLGGIVESWVAPVADAMVKAGADKQTARADARLGVAVVRGLLLDLLATGDRAGVTEAYERFLARAAATTGPTRDVDDVGSHSFDQAHPRAFPPI